MSKSLKNYSIQKHIKELIDYNPDSGLIYRKKIGSENKALGTVVKRRGKSYLTVCFLGKIHYAHRLAFIFMTGIIPNEIDHIDGNGMNNKWINLREVDRKNNCKNIRIRDDNKSGVTGVYFDKDRNKWASMISHSGKHFSLGRFENKELAIIARKNAEIEYGYHKNHGTARPL